MVADKAQLRRMAKARCLALTPTFKQAAAEKVALQLQQLACFQQSQKIACYLNDALELPTAPILQTMWQQHKTCYLPQLPKGSQESLKFVYFQPDMALQTNRFNISEPTSATPVYLEPEQLELVLVPLLGFTSQGYRLGHGGGYYDKTFQFVKEAVGVRPYLLGIAYACQNLEDMMTAAHWDVKLDGVVTEEASFVFS